MRSEDATAVRLHYILAVNIGPTGLHSRAPVVLELCEPVYSNMIELEANNAYLSRTLVLIKQLEAHFSAFAEKYSQAVFTQGTIDKERRCHSNHACRSSAPTVAFVLLQESVFSCFCA